MSPQSFLLEDLFESVTTQDVQQLISWLAAPHAYETGPLQISRRSVADRRTRYLMTKVNELPRNAELLLHEDEGKANSLLWELAKRLRMMCVPHSTYSCCSILRGHLGTRMPISAASEDAVMICWKKKETNHSVTILRPQSLPADWDSSHWCIMLYWNPENQQRDGMQIQIFLCRKSSSRRQVWVHSHQRQNPLTWVCMMMISKCHQVVINLLMRDIRAIRGSQFLLM